jgi:hypothetical protein
MVLVRYRIIAGFTRYCGRAVPPTWSLYLREIQPLPSMRAVQGSPRFSRHHPRVLDVVVVRAADTVQSLPRISEQVQHSSGLCEHSQADDGAPCPTASVDAIGCRADTSLVRTRLVSARGSRGLAVRQTTRRLPSGCFKYRSKHEACPHRSCNAAPWGQLALAVKVRRSCRGTRW